MPLFILRGKHEIEVEGCTGILEYEGEKITLAVGRDRFTVRGSRLCLEDFSEGVLYVRGDIASASFEGEAGPC